MSNEFGTPAPSSDPKILIVPPSIRAGNDLEEKLAKYGLNASDKFIHMVTRRYEFKNMEGLNGRTIGIKLFEQIVSDFDKNKAKYRKYNKKGPNPSPKDGMFQILFPLNDVFSYPKSKMQRKDDIKNNKIRKEEGFTSKTYAPIIPTHKVEIKDVKIFLSSLKVNNNIRIELSTLNHELLTAEKYKSNLEETVKVLKRDTRIGIRIFEDNKYISKIKSNQLRKKEIEEFIHSIKSSSSDIIEVKKKIQIQNLNLIQNRKTITDTKFEQFDQVVNILTKRAEYINNKEHEISSLRNFKVLVNFVINKKGYGGKFNDPNIYEEIDNCLNAALSHALNREILLETDEMADIPYNVAVFAKKELIYKKGFATIYLILENEHYGHIINLEKYLDRSYCRICFKVPTVDHDCDVCKFCKKIHIRTENIRCEYCNDLIDVNCNHKCSRTKPCCNRRHVKNGTCFQVTCTVCLKAVHVDRGHIPHACYNKIGITDDKKKLNNEDDNREKTYRLFNKKIYSWYILWSDDVIKECKYVGFYDGEVRRAYTLETFVKFMLSNPGLYVSCDNWNFDNGYLHKYIMDNHKIIPTVNKKGRCYLRMRYKKSFVYDISRITSKDLKQLTDQYNINIDITKTDTHLSSYYAKAIYDCLAFFRKECIDISNMDPLNSGSTAQLSKKVCKTLCRIPHIAPISNMFAAKSFKGGMCDTWEYRVNNNKMNIVSLDVNKMYALMFRKMLPTIPIHHYGFREEEPFDVNDTFLTHDGFAKVTLKTPEDTTYIVNGSYFPIVELRYMVSLGYIIEKVHKVELYKKEEGLFDDFLNKYEGVMKTNKPFAKMMINSLFGSLSQKTVYNVTKYINNPEQFYKLWLDKEIVSITPFENYHEVIFKGYRKAYTISTAVSAYITAYGRIMMHEALTKIRELGGSPIRCDTDGFLALLPKGITLGDHFKISDNIGDWKIEYNDILEVTCLNKKIYGILMKDSYITKGVSNMTYDEFVNLKNYSDMTYDEIRKIDQYMNISQEDFTKMKEYKYTAPDRINNIKEAIYKKTF